MNVGIRVSAPARSVDSRRTNGRKLRALVASIFAVVLLAFAGTASATPRAGTALPPIKLVDGWDRELQLGTFQRPVLVLYEDESSTKQNKALKQQLLELGRTKRYRDGIASVLVADVTGYDHWPAKDAAKAELRKWSTEIGVVVYADFSGEARSAFVADKGLSNILVYSKDGKLLFARSGELDDKAVAELLALLANQTSPPT